MIWPIAVSLVVAFLLTQVASVATSVYLHRAITHQALKLHRLPALVFQGVIWLTVGVSRREWAAVHRKHHAHTDQEGDPHSPYLLGFWQVQFFNAWYYGLETRNRETLDKFAKDIPPSLWDNFGFRLAGLAISIGCLFWIFLWWQALLIVVVHTGLYIFLNACVNAVGHNPRIGYKTFDNTAQNVPALAIFSAGEGLHNNHHWRPSRPKLAYARSEIDPGWWIIWLLHKLKLCSLKV